VIENDVTRSLDAGDLTVVSATPGSSEDPLSDSRLLEHARHVGDRLARRRSPLGKT